jgi:hypothetical protein
MVPAVVALSAHPYPLTFFTQRPPVPLAAAHFAQAVAMDAALVHFTPEPADSDVKLPPSSGNVVGAAQAAAPG